MAKKVNNYWYTGQDGSYLSEFLIDKGYEMHGTKKVFFNKYRKNR